MRLAELSNINWGDGYICGLEYRIGLSQTLLPLIAEIANQLGYWTDLMDKACYLAAHNCAMLLYFAFQRGNA